ncbi:hypothetical protein BDEG_25291 [Batrachochytrium dendrobatidis JEL423]|uniref:Uncharacterized protein n=1 Tax=Batrachochytrium dendrobatidis (strain JEL423) TaxID=403673 RepID=A0A177WPY9_BATDL|nr:hypothetical protein BDEG_25291 [Batrachochytrium dendrobatidis JEL423]
MTCTIHMLRCPVQTNSKNGHMNIGCMARLTENMRLESSSVSARTEARGLDSIFFPSTVTEQVSDKANSVTNHCCDKLSATTPALQDMHVFWGVHGYCYSYLHLVKKTTLNRFKMAC